MDWKKLQPPSGNTGAQTEKPTIKYPAEILTQMYTQHLTSAEIEEITRQNSTPHRKVSGTVCQDWLRFTSRQRVKLYEVQYHLQKFWPQGSFLALERGRYGYSGAYRNMYGVEMWFSQPGELNAECFTVDIPGQALAALTLAQIIELTHMMVHRYKAKGKRADPAIDIFDGSLVTMNQIFKQARKGDVARARKWKPVGSGDVGFDPEWSVYFGSRKSDKFVRIYDKAAQQGLADRRFTNNIEWLRIEAELKDENAHKFICELAALHGDSEMLEKFRNLVLSAVRGTVEFVQRKGKERDCSIDTLKLHRWWEKLVDSVEAMDFRKPIEPLTVEKAMEWLEKQVAPSLAVVRAWFFLNQPPGEWQEYLIQLLLNGENRFQTKHKLALGFG